MKYLLDRRRKEIGKLTVELGSACSKFDLVADEFSLDEYDASFKLKEKSYPYSCTREEGLIIYKAVKKFGLRSGYEIATAFGFSSLFFGLALKGGNGVLRSLDCYVEEWKDDFLYDDGELKRATAQVASEIREGKHPLGYTYATSNSRLLGLSENVIYGVGTSPGDVAIFLKGAKLDFVFIDGGHFGEQPTKDLLSVLPFVGERCLFIFHDNNQNEYVGRAIQQAEALIGAKAIRMNTRYQLTLLGKNISKSSIKNLRFYSLREIQRLQSKSWFYKARAIAKAFFNL